MPIFGMNSNTSKPVNYLFSHGIADSHRQAYKGYVKDNPLNNETSDRYIIDNKDHRLVTFDYPDAGEGLIYPEIQNWTDLLNFKQNLKKISYRVDRANTDFAGTSELNVLAKQLACLDYSSKKIGIGVSRGASAWITLLGDSKKQDIPKIDALILESPFACMDDILRNIIGEYLYQYETARSMGHNLIRFIFSRYKKGQTTPLDAAANVPKDLPILIICSEEDSRVPAWSSKKLFQELQETGHTNVHFIKIEQGAHGKLIQGADGKIYRNAVHAFYMKYDLPHNQEYAQLGQEFMDANRPI